MNRSEWNALPQHNTLPADKTIGKKWRVCTRSGWLLGEYIDGGKPGFVRAEFTSVKFTGTHVVEA